MFKKKKKKEEEPVVKLQPIRVPQDPKLKVKIEATVIITGDEKSRTVPDDELDED